MLKDIIQPLKVNLLSLTSAGFKSDFKIAELKDLWSTGKKQPERNGAEKWCREMVLGSTLMLPIKCPVPQPSLQPVVPWRMDAAAGTFVSLPKSVTNVLVLTNVEDNFKRSDPLQDPHICGLNTDLPQLPTAFLNQ